jgi:hypothetical protein
MINLLSPLMQQKNAATYRGRLAVVALALSCLAAVAALALLAPSFILAQAMLVSAREHAELAERSIALREREAATAELAVSRERLAILDASRERASAYGTVAAVIGAREDIALVGIYAETSAERTVARMTGIAPTRESLLAFVARVRALPSVAEANLPVSDLTDVRDIDFSITIIAAAP